MALSNFQIEELSKKMNIPLEFVGYKDKLPKKLKLNRSYIINLQNEDDEGNGSHWCCFQVNKNKNDKLQVIYMDTYAVEPPEIVKKRIKDNFNLYTNYTTKNIQSIMAHTCGWYCLAFLHFINNFSHREHDLYKDTENFLAMFDDLDKYNDYHKNEFMLKHFFLSKDPNKRIDIDVYENPNMEGFTDMEVIKSKN